MHHFFLFLLFSVNWFITSCQTNSTFFETDSITFEKACRLIEGKWIFAETLCRHEESLYNESELLVPGNKLARIQRDSITAGYDRLYMSTLNFEFATDSVKVHENSKYGLRVRTLPYFLYSAITHNPSNNASAILVPKFFDQSYSTLVLYIIHLDENYLVVNPIEYDESCHVMYTRNNAIK